MIASACKQIDIPSAKIIGAKFTRLTQSEVYASLAIEGLQPRESVGSVSLNYLSNSLQILFIEGTQRAPNKVSGDSPEILEIAQDGNLSGTFRFKNAHGLQGILDALVQGIKFFHQTMNQSSPSVEADDIWFTGLRNCGFPASMPPSVVSGKVRVQCLRIHPDPLRSQSLLKMCLEIDGLNQVYEGQVSFAYRLKGK